MSKDKLKRSIKWLLHSCHIEMHKYSGVKPMGDYVRKNIKGELVGVEIGTHLGINAREMLKRMNIKMLYLIDPYVLYEDYKDGYWMSNYFGDFRNVELSMKRRLKKYQNRYTLIKKMSEDATNDIPDNLDFVYVDGNHDYKHTLQDIELYYSKLKEGGVMGGHDFNCPDLPEVTNAVIDFVQKNKLQLNSHIQDWWVIKGVGRRRNEIYDEDAKKFKEKEGKKKGERE